MTDSVSLLLPSYIKRKWPLPYNNEVYWNIYVYITKHMEIKHLYDQTAL